MKMLMISPAYKPAWVYGGPTYSVSSLCESLRNKGMDIDVFTSNANGDLDFDYRNGHHEKIEGIEVTYFRRWTGDPFSFTPFLSLALMRTIRKFDVIHINGWWNWISVTSVILCKIFAKPYVLSPRGSLSGYTFGKRGSGFIKKLAHLIVLKRILRNSFFHFSSNIEKNEVEIMVSEFRYAILPNLLALPGILDVDKEKNEVFTIIFLGRIDPKKNIELLARALEKVSFPYRVLIVGDGDKQYISQLKDTIKQKDSIKWMGPCYDERKFQLLMEADLFVLLSFSENYGNAVIESLSAGTPVMVSEYVGARDFVEEYNLGWVIPLELDKCTLALQEAYDQKEKCAEIRMKAPRIVKDIFLPDSLAERYIKECYTAVN